MALNITYYKKGMMYRETRVTCITRFKVGGFLFGESPPKIIVNREDEHKIYERQIRHVVNNNCEQNINNWN